MSKHRHHLSSDQKRFDRHAISSSTTKEINDRLTAIYQDEDGEMPDMKHIKIKKRNPVLRALLGLLVLATLISLGAWAKILIFPNNSSLSGEGEIILKLTGPTTISFGATSTYTIAYENNMNVPLRNTIATLRYPTGFVFVTSSLPTKNTGHNEINLGTVSAKNKGSFTITGVMYGGVNQTKSWTASLSYQPEGITSVQQKIANLETTVTDSPFTLSITGPDKVAIGTETEFIFTVKNEKGALAQPLEIAPILPDNFSVTTSTPVLGSNKHWAFTSPTSTSASFKLRGKYTGTSNDVFSPIKGQLLFLLTAKNQSFSVAETTLNTELTSNNLSLTMSVNGSAESPIASAQGQKLTIAFNIKNTTKQTLKDVTARLLIQGPSVNKKSVMNWDALEDTHSGKVIGEQISDTVRQGSITWNKTQIPALAELKPNSEVTVEINLPVKTAAEFDLSNIKDKTITIISGVTARDDKNKEQTVSSLPLSVTLGAAISFENRHSITTDDGKEIHALNWVLNNSSSGLKNIQISADVYGDIAFAESSAPSAGIGKYDETKKHLLWTMSELPAQADVVSWPFTITVNTKNPTQTYLMSKVTVTAEDAETGNKIAATADAIPLNTD